MINKNGFEEYIASVDIFKQLNLAITVCDKSLKIVYMNDKAMDTFKENGYLIGKNLLDCHKDASKEKIQFLLDEGKTNVYTIDKKGVYKLIYQTPWYKEGKIEGLMEISCEIPKDMPHFIR